jgi:hypothetical protein
LKKDGQLLKENVKSKEIFERKFGRKAPPYIFALPFKKRGCSSKKEMQKLKKFSKENLPDNFSLLSLHPASKKRRVLRENIEIKSLEIIEVIRK